MKAGATLGGPRDIASDVFARAQAGDQAAFTHMIRHYDPRLRALAFRLLHDASAMEDVLQDAYVKAYRSLPAFRSDCAIGTWLHRIVYNCCLDALRAAARRPTSSLAGVEFVADPGPDPSHVAAQRTDVARALATLPVDQRAAVLLVDGDRLGYAEVAVVLGVAPGTVASRLSRARATMRAALAKGENR